MIKRLLNKPVNKQTDFSTNELAGRRTDGQTDGQRQTDRKMGMYLVRNDCYSRKHSRLLTNLTPKSNGRLSLLTLGLPSLSRVTDLNTDDSHWLPVPFDLQRSVFMSQGNRTENHRSATVRKLFITKMVDKSRTRVTKVGGEQKQQSSVKFIISLYGKPIICLFIYIPVSLSVRL